MSDLETVDWDAALRDTVADLDRRRGELIRHMQSVHGFSDSVGNRISYLCDECLVANHEQLHEYGKDNGVCRRCGLMVSPEHLSRGWC
jgi:hypothetical protein